MQKKYAVGLEGLYNPSWRRKNTVSNGYFTFRTIPMFAGILLKLYTINSWKILNLPSKIMPKMENVENFSKY